MPKNVRDPLVYFIIQLVAKNLKSRNLWRYQKLQKSHNAKNNSKTKPFELKKVERGASDLECFVFHVRGFGCVENQVLRAPCTKSGPFRVRLTKNTSHCNSRAPFLKRKAPTKNSYNSKSRHSKN